MYSDASIIGKFNVYQSFKPEGSLAPNNFSESATSMSWNLYQNLGESNSAVIKGRTGKVFAFTAYNKSTEKRWLHLYDTANTIAGKPKESHPVFANSYLILDFNYFGSNATFEKGITFGFSTEPNSFVPAPALNLELHLKYQ